MTVNRLVIRNDECVLENTETHRQEFITSKLLDKYILYITDKLINMTRYWSVKVPVYQQELGLYRNYLYSYSDGTMELDSLEVSQLFYDIKTGLLNGKNIELNSKDGTSGCVDDEILRQICEDYISDWLLPELLTYICEGSLFLCFEDKYGIIFEQTLIRSLQEYGIEAIEETIETNKNVSKLSITYRGNVLISVDDFSNEAEFDIIADCSIVEGFELFCESESESRNVIFRFPFIKCNDVIHFCVAIVNERILISATNSRIGITVRKYVWG